MSFRGRILKLGALAALTTLLPQIAQGQTFTHYCEKVATLPPGQRVVVERMVARVRSEVEATGASDVGCAALGAAAATMFRVAEASSFLEIGVSGPPDSFDLTPLRALPALEDLVVSVDGLSAENSEVLGSLHGLKQLQLMCGNGDTQPCAWFGSERLSSLSNLKLLTVSGLRLETSRPLADLGQLELLRLDHTGLRDLDGIGRLVGLRDLSVEANALVDLTDLMALINLRTLTLSGNPQVKDLMAVRYMVNLEQLYLADCGVDDLEPLRGLSWLATLDVNVSNRGAASGRVRTLSPLRGLKHLASLKVSNNSLDDLGFAAIGEQLALKQLDLSGNALSDIDPLSAMPELRILMLARLPQIQSYAALSTLTRLHHLSLAGSGLRDVPESLRGNDHVGSLDLSGNPISSDGLASLGSVGHLTELYVREAALTDLGRAPVLKRLRLLDVSGNAVRSLAPLAAWPALQNVIAKGVPLKARVCPTRLSCTFD